LHVAPEAGNTIVTTRRENFIRLEMHELFGKLTRLNISFEELEQQHILYLETHKDIQDEKK
jgi:hypothetical protein